MEQLLLGLARVPAPSLSNFAPGRNAETLSALRAWVEGETKEDTLYLWGQEGCGRTHLLRAVIAEVAARGRSARYCPAEADVLAAAAVSPAWIAVDDIDRLTEPGQAALFTLLNAVATERSRLLLAGPSALANLLVRPDVRTRVAAGLVFRLHGLSDEDLVRALCRHATERGFALSETGARHLLYHARRDLASLLTILDAVDRYSLQTKRPVTLALIRQVLEQAGRLPGIA